PTRAMAFRRRWARHGVEAGAGADGACESRFRLWGPPRMQTLSRIGSVRQWLCGALRPLLDRDVHHVAPLGPRPVVVLHVVVPEQLVQHEPGMGRALPDPAVGDDRVAVHHALAAVELA